MNPIFRKPSEYFKKYHKEKKASDNLYFYRLPEALYMLRLKLQPVSETASNALMYIVVILLGTSVGASTSAEAFLNVDTLKIVVLGLVAFACGTFGGVMLGKLLCKVTHGKINPLIGSAGVSAVPMAARVSQKVGAEADPTNFLLMHAMGPNVAGVIGTAVAAGTFMAIFGV